MARERQQSSIEPSSFYGKQPECRVPPTFDSSPSITDKDLTNENKHQDAGRSENTSDKMTPPDSSPVKGSHNRRKSTGAHMQSETNVDDDDAIFPTPESSLLKRNPGSADSLDHQNAKGLPQPGRSFNLQRRRYNSVPARSISRTMPPSEPNASPQPAQSLHDHALHEILHKLVNVEKKLASVEKNMLERLPATPAIQNAAGRPAPAVTAAAAVANDAERPQRRKRKRVSDAVRQLQRPKLDGHVPDHLRLPDEDIIRIGRTLRGYEKHVQAHYAFDWRGVVRARYKHLFKERLDGLEQ